MPKLNDQIDLNSTPTPGQPIGNDSVQRYVASTRPLTNFDLGGFEVQGSTGMDAFFAREPQMITPPGSRVRVASLQQLSGFTRLSSDMLIHKSDRDLWSIKREANGTMVIERMFNDNGKPLKG